MKPPYGPAKWPNSRWTELLPLALDLLDALPPDTPWTFGGGTRLALLYDHRISYDIDIFVTDAQFIGHITPRLNDRAAALFGEAYDEHHTSIKFLAEAGDIDIIVGRRLTDPGFTDITLFGRSVSAETAEEILAKKLLFRGPDFALRDCFDLATVLALDPAKVALATDACPPVALARVRQRLELLLPNLSARLPDYVNPTPSGAAILTHAAPLIRAWLDF